MSEIAIRRLIGALQAIAMNPQLPSNILAGIARNILDDPEVAAALSNVEGR